MTRSPNVVIAIPLASPYIYWRTVAALLEMEKPGGSELMVFQGALVDRARNRLVQQMLDHPIGATHLFFLDADVIPARDTLLKLLKAGQPIVGGIYRRRLPPYEPMAFRKKGRDLKPISLGRGSQIKTVDYIATGCLLIERQVFEKIRSPWFTSEWRKSGHLSEDFSFCEKARNHRYRIWCHTGVRPLHLEPMGVGSKKDGSVTFVSMD